MVRANQNIIRVLQIAGGFRANVNGKSVAGGVASFLCSYCTAVKNENLHFDFLALRNQCFEPYRDELESIGGNLYTFDLQSNGIKRAIQLVFRLYRFIKENHYEVIHTNLGSFFPSLCCAVAGRLAGVKTIIVHSHSSGIYSRRKRFAADIMKPFLTIFATKYCACSKVAAENLFTKRLIDAGKVIYIKNAVDTNKFKFNSDIREEKRKELGVNDELIIGHVGRFVEVKNHEFLLDIFKMVNNQISNSKLLLVGEGELRESIVDKAKEMGLRDEVIFLGHKNNVNDYLQAMDVFILPSIVEGFPISALEAQADGLPCYISSNISREVEICDNCIYFDLSKGASNIADKICNDIENRSNERKDTSETIKKAGFDLKDNIDAFVSLYKGV